jgi:hypothetical protein
MTFLGITCWNFRLLQVNRFSIVWDEKMGSGGTATWPGRSAVHHVLHTVQPLIIVAVASSNVAVLSSRIAPALGRSTSLTCSPAPVRRDWTKSHLGLHREHDSEQQSQRMPSILKILFPHSLPEGPNPCVILVCRCLPLLDERRGTHALTFTIWSSSRPESRPRP